MCAFSAPPHCKSQRPTNRSNSGISELEMSFSNRARSEIMVVVCTAYKQTHVLNVPNGRPFGCWPCNSGVVLIACITSRGVPSCKFAVPSHFLGIQLRKNCRQLPPFFVFSPLKFCFLFVVEIRIRDGVCSGMNTVRSIYFRKGRRGIHISNKDKNEDSRARRSSRIDRFRRM